MFTGIITDIGEVVSAHDLAAGKRFRLATAYDPETVSIGASIACGGPCLTVVEKGANGRPWFAVEASSETLARTTIGSWEPGTRVNLERALRAADELGGHLVTGHIDGIAEILERRSDGDMAEFRFAVPDHLSRFIAEKGSVGLDGTSLTVNSVAGATFTVMIIPHTLTVTTWGERVAGDVVNLEIDLVARYLDRLRGG
ncbi:riboflavin synthase [Afifella sp. IM 167]|uniref:riboflavin synthase n=1 Tax=Afifella sp. IM 167 TaxID=2033586 RepID=UPI001CCEAC1B|nr:riboflavin synthase [Afifella sp. IM 167]MBZ8132595.1 riboflavin synthase [Afifella sp. IM 167]